MATRCVKAVAAAVHHVRSMDRDRGRRQPGNVAIRVAHLTSAHRRSDTRIFVKQCRSLATFHDVTLVVGDGMGNQSSNGVSIIDAGKSASRIRRMAAAPWRTLSAAPDADLYHLHDPELIPVGLHLKRNGKTVIFDAHEDLPQQILSKHYLPHFTRKPVSALAASFEMAALKRFDGIVAATPHIRSTFAGLRTIDICNYPVASEIRPAPWCRKEPAACYVGTICPARGSREIRDAATRLTHGRFIVAGGHMPETRNLESWGFLDRLNVHKVLDCSMVGIVTLHPTPAYLPSLPVKMFEYMAAGIPVIASDFPLWRQIVTEADCGVLVDPLNPRAIAEAVDYFLSHPAEAERLGRNGRQAVEQRYNWSSEARKLRDFYLAVLGSDAS